MIVRGRRSFFRLFAAALLVAMLPGASRAYSPEQQQACTPDAMRLCGAYIPDVDRITACMTANKAQLSPGCRMYFRPGREAGEVADVSEGRPLVMRPTARKKPKFRKPKRPAGSGD